VESMNRNFTVTLLGFLGLLLGSSLARLQEYQA
jgi:hypothetical protein